MPILKIFTHYTVTLVVTSATATKLDSTVFTSSCQNTETLVQDFQM